MKKVFVILLVIMVFGSVLSGCTEKKTYDTGKAADASDTASSQNAGLTEGQDSGSANSGDDKEEGVEEKNEPENTVYTWEGCTFEFNELTTEIEAYESDLDEPEGKWVRAQFTIMDGEIKHARMEELIINQNGIKLGAYLPQKIKGEKVTTFDANGIAGSSIVYNVFFDVDKEYEADVADLYVAEEIASGEEDDAGAETSDAVDHNDQKGTVKINLGNDKDVEIGIDDISIKEDGCLAVSFSGITIDTWGWRELKVFAVFEDDIYFLRNTSASKDGFIISSIQPFETLPERLLIGTITEKEMIELMEAGEDVENSVFVYDVAAGKFIEDTE